MITLIHGDCLVEMPRLVSGCVDMVLCDLPYGTTQNKWDSVIPLQPMWFEYHRLCRSGAAVVLTAQTPFDKILGASNVAELKYEWIWKKNVATGHLNANRAPMKEHENVLVFCEAQSVYNPQKEPGKPYKMKRKPLNDSGSNYGNVERSDTINTGDRFPRTVLCFDRETGVHPTQKPVALMEYLIRTYTNEGDTVLDNTMGSGTTGVACVNTGRNFIGIERDAEYFRIAQERIEGARAPIQTISLD